MRSRRVIRWLIFLIAISSLVMAGGLLVARSLKPAQQESLLNRLPAFLRPIARSLMLPDHPDTVSTPFARATADVASLLTPRSVSTRSQASTDTPLPTSSRTSTPTPAPGATLQSTRLAFAPHTLTPVAPPGPTQAARSTPASLDTADVLLTGFRHVYQTWNNCGPATLSMNLSFYGWPGGQADAADFLKPDREDKNVSPDQMVAFAQSAGFEALARMNGSISKIRQFLEAGVPIIVEKGFEPNPDDGWEGHYELIVGYDDARQEFIAMDSYTGPNQSVPYRQLDWYWSHFNRTYIVVFTPVQADAVRQLLGPDIDPESNIACALAVAQAEASAHPDNPFAWFNVGSSFVALNEYESAAVAYDQARALGLPWRMTWYQFGMFEAYLRAGRLDDVMTLADATLSITPYIEELWYYRGLVHRARGELDTARRQFEQALVYNANFKPAAEALATLGQ